MSCKSKNNQTLLLADMEAGQRATLQKPDLDSRNILRLVELGMTDGESVQLIRKGPFGDPIQVAIRGTRLCMRRVDAKLFPVGDVV